MARLPPPRHPRFRLWVERLIWLSVAALLWRTWYLQGLLIPCQVVSGSMADGLLGTHRDVTCADCHHQFAVGTDQGELPPRAVCPNCGYADNDLGSLPDLAGDRLVIHKSLFRLRRPRRWEVVAFAGPEDATKILVKRVVGLPGETIQIRHGDVYADGEIVRKNLAQQRALAVLVHDADRPTTLAPRPPPRWQAEGDHSQWGSAEGRFVHAATDQNDPIDWLSYCHWRRIPGKPGEVREEPVADDCGYDQTLPRRVEDCHVVTDLMLSFRLLETFGQGQLVVRVSAGVEQFQVWIDPAAGRYRVLRNGSPVPGATGKLPPLEDGITVEVSLFDRQLLLAFDGYTAATVAFEPGEQPAKPTTRPLALGAQGLGVALCNLRVYRDVYYTHPIGPEARWGLDSPVRLSDGEYFVLGDNSPISQDSRTWPSGPGVSAHLLIGRPLLVIFPARRIEWWGRGFQVPDPARIRYIR